MEIYNRLVDGRSFGRFGSDLDYLSCIWKLKMTWAEKISAQVFFFGLVQGLIVLKESEFGFPYLTPKYPPTHAPNAPINKMKKADKVATPAL